MSSQTNEDGISEEAQTDEINLKNRWTQHPPALFHPNNTMAHPMVKETTCFWDRKSIL